MALLAKGTATVPIWPSLRHVPARPFQVHLKVLDRAPVSCRAAGSAMATLSISRRGRCARRGLVGIAARDRNLDGLGDYLKTMPREGAPQKSRKSAGKEAAMSVTTDLLRVAPRSPRAASTTHRATSCGTP